MPKGARRLLLRRLLTLARRALLMWCLWHTAAMAQDRIISAQYEAPTTRYAHAVLGDNIEYGKLTVTLASGTVRSFVLPQTSVFEDTAPRLVDLDGDSRPEVVTVEADQSRGARLAIYGSEGRITATPYIGTRFRWLAPVGAADLDGDGRIEIAYVDRPHLAKTLRIWRFEDAALTQIATFAGVSNHRIGEVDIAGGMRLCGDDPEMILANANWTSLLALQFQRGQIAARDIGKDTSRSAFAAAMSCAD